MRAILVAPLSALVGVLAGGLVTALLLLGPVSVPPELTFAIGTPGAHLVSWLSGWPLEQEAALACYALGFAITPPIVLGVIGAVVGLLLPRASAQR